MGILDNAYKLKEKRCLKIKSAALAEAKHIAVILGKKFGAAQVTLYGSLTKGKSVFDSASDIDLAVKGLGDKYFKAYGYCLRISNFSLDLRAYEDMPYQFRLKVDREGRRLYERKDG